MILFLCGRIARTMQSYYKLHVFVHNNVTETLEASIVDQFYQVLICVNCADTKNLGFRGRPSRIAEISKHSQNCGLVVQSRPSVIRMIFCSYHPQNFGLAVYSRKSVIKKKFFSAAVLSVDDIFNSHNFNRSTR